MVDNFVHVHELRMKFEHQRGLENAAVLHIPSGEAIGIQRSYGVVENKVPVRQENDTKVMDAVPA